MNVIGSQGSPVTPDPDVWEQREMRDALAQRDISTVYRLLRRVGVSQRQIAALTGQSQSEVSEILKGRQVMAYDVLARIADGLRIPRGYMGLAYDEVTRVRVAERIGDSQAEEEESVKRRRFLAHAAAVTMGAAVLGSDGGTWVPSPAHTPAPARIGFTDVRQVEAATRALRALDYQYGGGFCRDAVVAQLSWAQQLLQASAQERVKDRLYVALADLHGLAGWTAFDTGLLDSARDHYGRALEFAKQGGDNTLVANLLYRMGRVYLHDDSPDDALKMFQLGQIAAQETASDLTVSLLCMNEAWAYAMMGREEQAMKLVGMARDSYCKGQDEPVPIWLKFFDQNDFHAMVGTIHTALAHNVDPGRHTRIAIPELTKAIEGYGSAMARSKAFNLTSLALNHVLENDVDRALVVGQQALESSDGVKSKRIGDRMKPLHKEAVARATNPHARDLADRIARFRFDAA
ncbi:helix-turn-helix transcriptional regulator [Streptoalloteichus hindustanus]|uniref:Transcriptional regulator, contains XRE-family HTH domain n=1 Tax=Streptoalloteichus hindustanus TaxID=2017 RepID=A0A1M4V856_STRHI|nr:helix-turn-helix transcriptional regulator [Streptoalloteichus hindustanus]SHE65070.1 Transcriptional regulator, contains XRE-family HTH domain [Streptoalloteichus hindustanus]